MSRYVAGNILFIQTLLKERAVLVEEKSFSNILSNSGR